MLESEYKNKSNIANPKTPLLCRLRLWYHRHFVCNHDWQLYDRYILNLPLHLHCNDTIGGRQIVCTKCSLVIWSGRHRSGLVALLEKEFEQRCINFKSNNIIWPHSSDIDNIPPIPKGSPIRLVKDGKPIAPPPPPLPRRVPGAFL